MNIVFFLCRSSCRDFRRCAKAKLSDRVLAVVFSLPGCFPGELTAEGVIMTKLMQWLCSLSLLAVVWALIAYDLLDLNLPQTYRDVAWPMPAYLLVSFGCYSLAVIGYRVATFNDCEEASRELRMHIKEAREELRKKGLRF